MLMFWVCVVGSEHLLDLVHAAEAICGYVDGVCVITGWGAAVVSLGIYGPVNGCEFCSVDGIGVFGRRVSDIKKVGGSCGMVGISFWDVDRGPCSCSPECNMWGRVC